MRKSIWLVTLALGASWAGAAEVYDIDPAHSTVGFKIKHLGITTVPGKFAKFKGTVTLDKHESAAARVEAVIDAASIDTGIEARDKHLKSPDFFDVGKYPELKFVSTRISKMKGDKFVMEGELTMHGVTKPVKLDAVFGGEVNDPWGGHRAACSATGSLNRKDFGLAWNKVMEAGGLMVGEQVQLAIEVEGILRAEKPKEPAQAKP
ncbi:MAG: YceI family protein [Elusimicrobia bacterium]|nr:YceI family protein [Elusimicrobiota bacterium]